MSLIVGNKIIQSSNHNINSQSHTIVNSLIDLVCITFMIENPFILVVL